MAGGFIPSTPTVNDTPLNLFQKLFLDPDTTGWSDFVSNPKGFFQDVAKVSQYSPSLGAQATASPSTYFASYDQFLKGTNQGTQPGGNGGTFQYEGDSSYYRPIVSKGSGQWYDYKNNAFKNLGDGFETGGGAGGGAPPPNLPPDTSPVTSKPKPKPKGDEYKYGNKNPYMGDILGLGTQINGNKKNKANIDYLATLLGR